MNKPRPFLPFLLLLFAGSGCSALIYEIVWFQLLQLVIGSSAISLGVLLGTFMGGMCLGSLALPRFLSDQRHPLRVYALLELGIGVIGILALYGVPYVDGVYTSFAAHGLPSILLRGVVASVCLLPPTMLMGATLPAIARWLETTPQGVSWLGFFYGGNIAGAVFGCLLAGFYLLRVHDMAVATYVASCINVGVAMLSLGLSFFSRHQALAHAAVAEHQSEPVSGSWVVYLTIALSGASALAAEVIWTRLLSLMLGATVYTFSIILAVFLVGLGIGSSLGSYWARESKRPGLVLGGCQLLLTAAIAWTGYMLAKSLPFWPINPTLTPSPWIRFQLDLARCFWAVLPATCLWGASFPLALAAVARRDSDPGRLVGGVYAANTVGAIFGALAASLLLVQWLGTQNAERVLIGISAVAAILILTPELVFFRETDPISSPVPLVVRGLLGTTLIVLGACLAGALAWNVPATPWELVAFGRSVATKQGVWNKLFMGEGLSSSVAVTELENGVRNFHVSGKIEASSEPQDMRLQRMLGHMPALIHPKPRSALIVGCGAGVTAGSFVLHPDIERIVICEIEPLVPKVVAGHFAAENYGVVNDPRVQIVYDDARHYVLTTREQFDIITSDPIHPWVKGSAALYTKEYFELCKKRLNPGGVVTQWVPLYESSLDVVKSEIATFFDAFPHGTIWSNDSNGEGYDVVLLGQAEPTIINVDAVQERLERPEFERVAISLKEVSFATVVGLFGTYAGQASDLKPWLKDAEINHDRNLRLQYLAGLWLDSDESKYIHDEMIGYRRFPDEIFQGKGMRNLALRRLLKPPSANP